MPYATPSPSTSPTASLASGVLPSPPRSGPSSPPTTSPLASPPNGLVRTWSRANSLELGPDRTGSPPKAAAGATRPFRARNHVRSYSHEGTPSSPSPSQQPHEGPSSNPGYIYVQPATPNGTPDRSATALPLELAAPPPPPPPPPPPRPSPPPAQVVVGDEVDASASSRPRKLRLGFGPVLPLSEVKSRDFALPRQSPSRSPDQLTPTAPAVAPKRPLHQKSRTDLRIDLNELAGEGPFKTPMLRKKSGELVRPALRHGDSKRSARAKSAPATPMGPKNVHFDAHLEHVKHFLAQQRPTAVSRDGSPIETETEGEEEFPFPQMNGLAAAKGAKLVLSMPNFPLAPDLDGKKKDVYLRSLDVSEDSKSLRGVVQVKNLAFQKWVAIRFTFDTWQTVSEVSAEYLEPAPGGNGDRFAFGIKLHDLLARIEEKVMFLAIRYTVDGREIWDNNGSSNYRVEFRIVKPKLASAVAPASGPGAGAAADGKRPFDWSVTTAGQAQDRMAELRAELNRLVGDDFGVDVPAPSLKHAGTTPPVTSNATSGGAFSSRYDFGTSLRHAARNSPRTSPTNTPRKHSLAFPSTFIGGMPATSGQTTEMMSPTPRPGSLPGFVGPYVTASQRPPSPPPEREQEDALARRALPSRFHSLPPTRWSPPISFSKANPFDRLVPPRGSIPSFSPSGSPRASPLASPGTTSPTLSPSPPLDPQTDKHSFPSPSPTESGSSTPDSPPSESVARGSRGFDLDGGVKNRSRESPSESPTYGHFVQNFCWGGALGLTSASGEPLNSLGHDHNAAVCSVAMATPRSSSPLPPEVLEVASNIGRSNSPFHQGLTRQPISGS